jgi:hypothetical protein
VKESAGMKQPSIMERLAASVAAQRRVFDEVYEDIMRELLYI